ncbi:MAG TPA: hypothetical protein VJ600_01300 [Holophagaceae bacterium]|nr:hypothetical protein [Holophagaceae bacterium]
MTKLEKLSLHLAALLTGLTGLLYGWLRYYGQVQGEFGPEPHHLQPLMQHLHVLTAPLLLFALGLVVRGHLWPKLRSGRPEGRRTGLFLGLVLAPMVMSAYGLQIATEPAWRMGLAWIHGVTSLLFLLGYGVHLTLTLALRKPVEGTSDTAEELPLGTA